MRLTAVSASRADVPRDAVGGILNAGTTVAVVARLTGRRHCPQAWGIHIDKFKLIQQMSLSSSITIMSINEGFLWFSHNTLTLKEYNYIIHERK